MLFWQDIDVPGWLSANNVDVLKERLVGIIITLLAVLFLEHVSEWEINWELSHVQGFLMISISIALIILALVFYIRTLLSAMDHNN